MKSPSPIVSGTDHPGLPVAPILAAGILANIAGNSLNSALNLPLFLDSIGTILAAVVLGPWLGAAIGFLSNLLIGVFENPITIPFGIVNLVIGLIAGFISRTRGFHDFLTPLVTALILGLASPIVATPIAVYLFGGITGGNIDAYFAVLMESGYKIFSSAFLVRLPANLADKLISCYLVYGIIRLFPNTWKGWALSGIKKRDSLPTS